MSKRKRPKAPNGSGSVYERPDGSYRASVPIGWLPSGNAKRVTKVFDSWREADAWRMEMVLERDRGTLVLPSDLSFADLVAQWDARNAHWAHSTRRGNTGVLETHVIPYLGRLRVADLKPMHIEQLIAHLRTDRKDGDKVRKALSDSALARVLRRLRSVLAYAVQVELAVRNVALAVPLPVAKPTRHVRWTPAEAQRVMRVCEAGVPLGAYFYVGITTGLRKEELKGLRWRDVDLAGQVLTVQHVVVDESGKLVGRERTKTDAGYRLVHFDAGTQAVLIRQLDAVAVWKRDAGVRWEDNDLVFPTSIGRPLRDKALREALDEIQKAAKVRRIRLYDTRSTHGSILAEQGVNPKAISERLGHTDVAFTLQQYVRPSVEEQRGIAGLMGELRQADFGKAEETGGVQPGATAADSPVQPGGEDLAGESN